GAFNEATEILSVIREKEREKSELLRRSAEESRTLWIAGLRSEAKTCTLLARAALERRDVPAAREHIEEALRVLEPDDPEFRLKYMLSAADFLNDFGRRAASNDALKYAVQLYNLGNTNKSAQQSTDSWARIQMGLASALVA